MPNELLLPERAVLLHIGPHKTGTSAIQGALQLGQDAMAEHGVVYPGTRALQMQAARAALGVKGVPGDPQPTEKHWRHLCAEVAAAGRQRVIVSRETFCLAGDDAVHRIVDQLGGSRVHVLVTLRPLTKILPSAWQQSVRNRRPKPYEMWLDEIFNPPPEQTIPFWARHRHDVIVQRWASVVGPDRVTVLVVDDFEREQLLRPIEQLLGLPAGLLRLDPDLLNRSLSYPEIELIRRVAVGFDERRWSDRFYRDIVRYGMVRRLQQTRVPGADEPRIVTPTWAVDRAAEIGAAASERIAASGVRILGDITTLGAATSSAETDPGPTLLPVSAATEVVFGAVAAGVRREKALARTRRRAGTPASAPQRRAARGRAKDKPVSDLRSTELLAIVAHRIRRRLRRTLRRVGRR